MKRKYISTLILFVCAVTSSLAHAADRFLVLQRASATLTDASPSRVVDFTLPLLPLVNTSSSIANSAVLDIQIGGAEYDFNEVYINPPTTVCTANSTDANQAGSLGFFDEHDDTNLRGEWSTNHIAFSSSLLHSGPNKLLICIRSITGNAGPGVGNLDNISVRSIVLHYHTF